MATLEDRVNQLEAEVQELRHSSAVAGMSLGMTLIQNEVAELRRETRAEFTALRGEMVGRFDAQDARLDRIEQALQTLLERG